MSPEDFLGHPVFEKIKQLEELLNSEEVAEKVETDELNFFNSFLFYTKSQLNQAIPDLVIVAELDGIANDITSGISQINNYLGNSNQGHIKNARSHFHSSLTHRLKTLPVKQSEESYPFSKLIAEFQKSIEEKAKSIDKTFKSLEGKINDLDNNILASKEDLNGLTDMLRSEQIQIQNLTDRFQTELENITSKQNNQFELDSKEFQSSFQEEVKLFKNITAEQQGDISYKTDQLVNELNTKLEEAKKIVSVIGNVGVTGNYQALANSHKKTANFWRWTAIGFMIVFSILTIITIFQLGRSEFEWTRSLIRMVAAAALTYPATYASRESSKHRRLEFLNRKYELELASLNPFIELLEVDKQQEIKGKLVERYFGNNDYGHLAKDGDEEGLSLSGFETILNALSKFKK